MCLKKKREDLVFLNNKTYSVPSPVNKAENYNEKCLLWSKNMQSRKQFHSFVRSSKYFIITERFLLLLTSLSCHIGFVWGEVSKYVLLLTN